MMWQDKIYESLTEDRIDELEPISTAIGLAALGTSAYLGHKLSKQAKKDAATKKKEKAIAKEKELGVHQKREREGRWHTDVATGVDPLYKKELEHKRRNPNPNRPKSQEDIEASIDQYRRGGK